MEGATCQPDMMRSGSVSSAVVADLPTLPWSDWEIDPSDIKICERPDGTQWKLGAGGYGSVCSLLFSPACFPLAK